MSSLEGKVVIVTGAAGGIGLATSLRFAGQGAHVTLVDIDVAKAAAALATTGGSLPPDVLAVQADVGREADAIRAVDETLQKHGRLDVVVNNAARMIFRPLAEHTEEDLLDLLRINLLGAFWFTKQLFLHGAPGACIVNIASIHAVQTTPLVAAYAASKAALLSLTRSSAVEGRDRGIRANAILPGAIETPMLHANPNLRSGSEVLDRIDVGQPEDVAAAVVWLASDEARFVNGATLRVDGGRLAKL